MDSVPNSIGPYDIQREIGRGGMGVVYLARERATSRMVALKVLLRKWTSDPQRLKRFQREARTVARVRHPNVVPLYGVGEDDGLHYIAMKYIPGTSLDAMIRDQTGSRLRIEEEDGDDDSVARDVPAPRKTVSEPQWVYRAVRIVEKIARALGHLHDHGIVHRDVKPGNILIDQRGDPWLADFGLVRDVHADTVSEEDGILGTVQYIAPEQIDESTERRADHRSDLYSLGVTLYELATLRRPFAGLGTSSTLYAVAREIPTPPRVVNPGLSDDLDRVIRKAMSKDAADRYQTAAAFADDLQRVRTFKPVVADRPPLVAQIKRSVSRNPVLAAALLFAVLCLVGMIEYGVYCELTERRRLVGCRAEADLAFHRGLFDEAALGYQLYLKLGGHDAEVVDRLAFCRAQEPAWQQAPLQR